MLYMCKNRDANKSVELIARSAFGLRFESAIGFRPSFTCHSRAAAHFGRWGGKCAGHPSTGTSTGEAPEGHRGGPADRDRESPYAATREIKGRARNQKSRDGQIEELHGEESGSPLGKWPYPLLISRCNPRLKSGQNGWLRSARLRSAGQLPIYG